MNKVAKNTGLVHPVSMSGFDVKGKNRPGQQGEETVTYLSFLPLYVGFNEQKACERWGEVNIEHNTIFCPSHVFPPEFVPTIG